MLNLARPDYSPLTVALIRIGIPVSMPNTDMKMMAHGTDVGLRRVEAVAVVEAAVEDEVTTEGIDIVKENHAVSLRQEGEH